LYRSNSAAYELGRYDELHARAFDDESGWGLEQNLDRSGDNISGAHLAGSDDGTAIAVWEQSGVAWASHFDTVTWETVPTRLSFAADGYYGPVREDWQGVGVVMDARGNGIAVFCQFTDIGNTSVAEVFKVHYVGGVGWEVLDPDHPDLAALSTLDDGQEERGCTIAGTANGQALVIWFIYDGSTNPRLSRSYGE
jgi:hypothetical protein